MKTKINKTKTTSQKMSKPSTKEFLNKFKATGKELPISTIQEREAKAEEELDNIPYETKSKWEDNISEYSKQMQKYLLFDDDSTQEDTGTTDLPYYMEENKENITFDTNADSDQTEMNRAMKTLMEESGIGMEDLDLQVSYNMNSDSYLTFGSAEAGMPKDNLPIAHGGDDGEYEDQFENIEQVKRTADAKGVSDNAFRKWFEDSYPVRDDLYYDRVQTSWVTHVDKNKFLAQIPDKTKNANPEAVQTIKKYQA